MTLDVRQMLWIPFFVALVFSTPSFAQEIIDQENNPDSLLSFHCGLNAALGDGTILQSFVPHENALVGVEIRIRVRTSFPTAGDNPGTNTTIRILEDDAARTEIASATTFVSGKKSDGTLLMDLDQIMVRFGFTNVELVPGKTYLIEWQALSSDVASWVGRNDNPYDPGTAYQCFGGVWPGGETDFNFITYAAEADTANGEEILEGLQDDVKQLMSDASSRPSRRAFRRMLRTLMRVEREMDRGRTRIARLHLRVFRIQLVFARVRFGLPGDKARELYEQAGTLIDLLNA